MIDFIRKYNCYQLGNSCNDQIGVKCFLILSPSSCKTEIILDVVNISFYGSSYFISVIPFFGTTNSSRIGTKILQNDTKPKKFRQAHCKSGVGRWVSCKEIFEVSYTNLENGTDCP